MKVGVEAEGRLKGVRTLFVNASDVTDNIGRISAIMERHQLSHIYISDRDNVLDYSTLGNLFRHVLVTLDVTTVASSKVRPKNVTIMLTLPYDLWQSVAALGNDDQVKFHSPEREVMCISARHFVYTSPSDFAGDVEV